MPIEASYTEANISRKLKRLRKTLNKWEKFSFESIRRKKENLNKEIEELELKKENDQISMEKKETLGARREEIVDIFINKK